MQSELKAVGAMPVRDEDASDIFSELVPQVLRNTEQRNEVTNRLVRDLYCDKYVYSVSSMSIYEAMPSACVLPEPSRASR